MRDALDFQYQNRSAREIHTEIWLRYAQVRLALAAWRCDEQRYPEKLKELSPDYLASTFPHHYLKDAFSYHPDGLDLPVVLSTAEMSKSYLYGLADRVDSVIPAKAPFLLPWKALPTEQRFFQIKIPDDQDKGEFSTTDPALGYFMGQYWTNSNQSLLNNNHPELYVLGRKKLTAHDTDE